MKLEEIEKLCEEATPGPWNWDCQQLISLGFSFNDDKSVVMNEPGINKPSKSDAAFIATSRAMMPKLLAVAQEIKDSLREFECDIECQCCNNNASFISDMKKLIEELEKE